MHRLALELEEERACDPLEFSLQQQQLQAKQNTENLFKLTYDNAIHYRSFLDYESIVWLQHNNGMDVGDQLHSQDICCGA